MSRVTVRITRGGIKQIYHGDEMPHGGSLEFRVYPTADIVDIETDDGATAITKQQAREMAQALLDALN